MTVDPSAVSDLALLPAQQILVVDPNLLDHRLILSSFNHNKKIDPKESKIESPHFEQLQPGQQDRSNASPDLIAPF